MTKKDFIALADAIDNHNNYNGPYWTQPFLSDQLDTLARFCKKRNAKFKTNIWLDYIAGKCGPNGGKVK